MSTLSDKNREKAEETLLKSISVKCKECGGTMIRHVNHMIYLDGSRESTVVGYVCEDCPHYNLFD